MHLHYPALLRVNIRRGAPLEMPHTLLLMDDRTDSVLSLAEKAKDTLEKVYDFDLMLGGGYIAGWRVSGETKAAVQSALDALDNAALQREKYGDAAENGKLTFAVGDGNHSLAAAKRFWEEKRETLPENEREADPARFALVEIENIHEPSLDFEPIHRVIFDTDTSAFAAEFTAHRTEWEAEDKTLGERVAAAMPCDQQVAAFRLRPYDERLMQADHLDGLRQLFDVGLLVSVRLIFLDLVEGNFALLHPFRLQFCRRLAHQGGKVKFLSHFQAPP